MSRLPPSLPLTAHLLHIITTAAALRDQMQCAIIFSVKNESEIELIEFTILMHTYKSRVFLFSIKNWVGG